MANPSSEAEITPTSTDCMSAKRPAYMIIAPSPLNPLGIKGAGEGGITGAGAAVAAAIDDALGRPGAVTRLPVTPVRLHALLTHSTRSTNYS